MAILLKYVKDKKFPDANFCITLKLWDDFAEINLGETVGFKTQTYMQKTRLPCGAAGMYDHTACAIQA